MRANLQSIDSLVTAPESTTESADETDNIRNAWPGCKEQWGQYQLRVGAQGTSTSGRAVDIHISVYKKSDPSRPMVADASKPSIYRFLVTAPESTTESADQTDNNATLGLAVKSSGGSIGFG